MHLYGSSLSLLATESHSSCFPSITVRLKGSLSLRIYLPHNVGTILLPMQTLKPEDWGLHVEKFWLGWLYFSSGWESLCLLALRQDVFSTVRTWQWCKVLSGVSFFLFIQAQVFLHFFVLIFYKSDCIYAILYLTLTRTEKAHLLVLYLPVFQKSC